MPKMNKYDRTHLSHLSAYERLVDAVYREYMRKLTSLMPLSGEIKPSVAFSFDECPNIRKRAESLLDAMREGLFAVIVNGIDSEWTLANNKNNELSRQVFGENIGRLTQEQYRRYFSSNGSARDAFVLRRTAGTNLSDRVWNLTSQFKCEMEQVIDISIRNGIPAEEMQRELQQYLKNPDNFFRRFRFKEGVDDMGNPIYGRKWKKRYWDDATGGYKWMDVDLNDPKYRYGRGVYRSSYKNARRLAVTETNIAYRTADHLRWQQMDFVVGIRIEPSKTNHPVPDICDFLAGDYPKDFKWTGWHPHCRCHATSILKTTEEMAEDNRRILAGQEPVNGSVNEVKSVPNRFAKWVDNNRERAKGWETTPYFIRDNPKYAPNFVTNTYNQQERKFTRARKTKPSMKEAVEILHARYPYIPNTELAAIYHYTRGDIPAYRKLNKQLRNGSLDDFNKAFASLMDKGLEKLPTYEGISYRTMRLNKTQLREWLNMARNLETVTFDGFTSSTSDRAIAEKFADRHKGRKNNEVDVMIVIKGKSGRNIEKISMFGVSDNGFPNQKEILFGRGKNFRVVGCRKLDSGVCEFEFTIEEV